MHSCISDVADFRTAMGLPIAREPDLRPTAADLDRMVNLLHEEYDETRHAIGKLWDARRHGEGEQAHALAEVADGLADLIYVACGAALELGIPLGAVWAEVHRSNLAKVGGGRRADGKVLKPDGWQGPDVMGAVFGANAKPLPSVLPSCPCGTETWNVVRVRFPGNIAEATCNGCGAMVEVRATLEAKR